MKKTLFLISFFLILAFNSFSFTQIVNVANTVFSPGNFTINLGDSVKWVWVSGSHTTTSTTIPAGATAWNSTISQNITSFTYVPNVIGTYNYHCTIHPTMIGQFTVACPTPSVSIINPVPVTVCQGAIVLLNSNAAGGTTSYAYQWQSAPSATSAWTNINGATNSSYGASVNPPSSSTYYRVMVTNSCGNTAVSLPMQVTLITINVGVTPFQSSVCSGGCVNLSASATSNGGTLSGSYSWSPASGLNSTTGSSVTACPVNFTTYTVTFLATNGCTGSGNAFVSIAPQIIISETHINATCGFANGSIDLTVTGGVAPYTYHWSNGATVQDITNLASASYAVTVSNSTNCSSVLTVVITNTNGPTLSETHVNPSCGLANGSIDITVNGGAAPYTYNWSNGSNTQDLNNLSAGTYSFTVTDANGCTSTLTISLTGGNAITLSESHVNTNCGQSNGSINLTVSPVGNYSYVWSNGATTEDISGLSAGTYTVTVQSTGAGCTSTLTINITSISGTALCQIQSGTASFCAGGSAVLAITPVGTAYQWMKNGTNISSATNATYTATISGSYSCSVTYSCGTAVSNAIQITKLATPTATISANGPLSFCQGQSVTLNVNVQVGVTYQWRKNGVNIAGATNSSYTATIAGNYRVLVTKISTGCTKLSGQATVSIVCRDEQLASDNSRVTVYPNPFSEKFSIQLNTVSDLKAFNLVGQQVFEMKNVSGTVTAGETLLPGIYILCITENGIRKSVVRIVKTE